jgi:hypothetical protein
MKRREGVFSPKAQKRYVCKVSRIVKKYITVIYMLHQILQGIITIKLQGIITIVYSSLRIFSAASFNNLSTTLSMIEFAVPTMSRASFISGSARGSYGSGSGDSLAAVVKLLVRSHKESTEVKIQKQYLCASRVLQPLQFA